MQMPTIHLNGSSRESLKLPLYDATNGLHDALRALAEGSPNARDYYPQGPDAHKRATEEHAARVRKITEVRAELIALIEYIEG